MKTRLRRISKRFLALTLSLLMMLSSLSIASIIIADAYMFDGGYIYFVKPSSWSKVSLLVQNEGSCQSQGFNMSLVSGTEDLYYVNGNIYFGSNKDRYFAFVDGSDIGYADGGNDYVGKRKQNYSHYTADYDWGSVEALSSGYLLAVPESGNNGASVTFNHNSGRDYALNKTVKVYGYRKTNGSYQLNNSGGYVEVKSYTMSSDTAVSSSPTSRWTNSNSGTSCENYGVIHSNMDLIANPSSGYRFDGYYDGDGSGASLLSSQTTYSPLVYDRSIYARFSYLYNLTMSSGSGGSISATVTAINGEVIENAAKAAKDDSVTINITPNDGFELDTFTVGGSDAKSSISDGKYTFTMTGAAKTIAATFKSKNITYTKVRAAVNPSGAATVTPSTNQTVISGNSIQVSFSNIASGYRFLNWTAQNGKFGSTSGDTTTTTESPYFFPTASSGSADVIATANFVQVRNISLPEVPHAKVTAKYVDYAGATKTMDEGETCEAKVGENVTFTVTPDSGYSLGSISDGTNSITSSGSSLKLSYAASTLTYSVVMDSSWYIRGTLVSNKWDTTDSNNRLNESAEDSSGDTVSVSLALEEGKTYEFKLFDASAGTDGKWYTQSGSAYDVKLDETVGLGEYNGMSNNLKITPSSTSTYVFSFVKSTKSLTVISPSLNVSYTANSKASYNSNNPIIAKAGGTVTFKVKPNSGYYIKNVLVNDAAATNLSIGTTADSDGYITCSFKMPSVDATVSVVVEQLNININVNSATAGKVTAIKNSAGSSVDAVLNSSTGSAAINGKLSVGDTFQIVLTANSNGLYALNSGSTDITASGIEVVSMSSDATNNTYTYTCKVLNDLGNATVNFRASTPVITSKNVTEWEVGKSFTLSDFFEVLHATKYEYKWSTDSSYTEIGIDGTISAPNSRGDKTLQIRATNDRSSVISDSARQTATQTLSQTITFRFAESKVNLYVDTHGMSIESINMDIYDENGTRLTRNDGSSYGKALEPLTGTDADGNYLVNSTRVNSSVYGALSADVPRLESGTKVIIKVTVKSTTGFTRVEDIEINKDKLYTDGTVRDIWLETITKTKVGTYRKPATKTADDTKRIYIFKQSGWDSKWDNLYAYWWKADGSNSGWNSGDYACKKLGTDADSNTVSYVDIPSDAAYLIIKAGQNADSDSDVTNKNGGYAIGSDNCFKIINDSSNGNKPALEKMSYNALSPFITKYYTPVTVNTTDTDERAVNIAPSFSSEDGMKVTYSVPTAYKDYVDIDEDGNVIPKKDTDDISEDGVPVTVTLTGKIGNTIVTSSSGENYDTDSVTTYVKVNNPDIFYKIPIMSYESYETQVYINPETGSNGASYPATITGIKTTLSGTATGATYNSGVGVITVSDDKHTATVKYAKSSDLFYTDNSGARHNYDNISVKAQVIAKESPENTITHNRYGFYDWFVSDSALTTHRQFAAVLNDSSKKSTEYKNRDDYVAINGKNYIMHFDPYQYTDVAVTFYYYAYNPYDSETNTYKYFYDSTKRNIDQAGLKTAEQLAGETGDEKTEILKVRDYHDRKSYTIKYEHRYSSDSDTRLDQNTEVIGYVTKNARDIEDNYYKYNFAKSDVKNMGLDASNSYQLNVQVYLHDTPREYTLKVYDSDNQLIKTETGLNYQQYVTVSAENDSTVKWYDKKDNNLLATTPSYRFRISGDTTLVREAMGSGDKELSDGPNSVVSYSNYEFQQIEDSYSGTFIDYLFQNFFISDYYNPSMVTYRPEIPEYDEYGDIIGTSQGDPVPYDDITFVGAGVFYYSVDNDGVPTKDLVKTEGYVEEKQENDKTVYTTNTEVVGERILELIEAANTPKVESSLGDIVDEDKMEAVYAQEIKETVDVVRNQKTGLVYRYMPAYSIVTEQHQSDSGTYTTIEDTVFNSKEYRYSSLLGAYQYIYPVGMKNLPTNSNKNIRLHSYYVYSYTDYSTNNNGETIYKIVVSDSYAQAPTYVNVPLNVE